MKLRPLPLLGALLGLALLLRGGLALRDRLSPPPPARAAAPLVRALRLEPRPFTFTVPVSGTLEPARSALVFPKVEGRVVELYVSLGQRVRAGQALARVEAEEWALQARQAEAGLEAAEQGAEVARRSLERLEAVRERLGDAGISEQDYERARAEAEGAIAQAEALRAQRELARRMVSNAVLRSPFDGTVTAIWARLGNSLGHEVPAFRVEDLSSFRLRAELGRLDLPRVAAGQRALLRSDALPGCELEARVLAVSPSLDPLTRRAGVELGLEPPEDCPSLPGNLFVRGEIEVERDPGALVVPLDAVEQGPEGCFVLVARDGRVERLPVRLRGARGDEAALSGIEAGELVLVPGALRLAPGERVRVQLGDGDVAL